MKTLECPTIDNSELWEKIVANKRQPAKGKLLLVKDKVFGRYSYYDEHFNSLEKILPLPEADWKDVKDELISCYGNNVEFSKARQFIFSSAHAAKQTKCPYCMLNRPNTLDHYFDKDEYPEYSVYVPNLIPCCSECNTNKLTSVFDSNGNRKYLHFYCDEIIDKQFVFARFSCADRNRIPTVCISLRFEEDTPMSDLITRHFESLALLEKYRSEILDRIAPLLEEISTYHMEGRTISEIIELMEIRRKSLANHLGKNYWETCMYEGVINSPGFVQRFISVEE